MPIQVKFFAGLRERMGRAEDSVDSAQVSTVHDVWSRIAGGATLPPNTLAAVNAEYSDLHQPVKDGDEVAFFPPVTGG